MVFVNRIFAVVAGVCLVAVVGPVAVAAEPTFVWWEGEAAAQTNFPERTWFDAQDAGERDKLSGGDWLTNSDKRQADEPTPTARYRVVVPETGKYQLWARKFWKHGPFRWRFDDGPWRTCGRDVALADSVGIRTHVVANWVHLGAVELERGRRSFTIELLAEAGDAKTAAFDAFVLIDGAFRPRGKLKPGEKYNRADPGYFPFEPGTDAFGNEAALDLRPLNEKLAGMNGRVRQRGDRFVLGDGSAVRFWGANVSIANAGQQRQTVDYLAAKLARLGFNAVRFHAGIWQANAPDELDRDKLDDVPYLVEAMRRQGIYTTASIYFPLWFDARRAGLAGFDRIDNNRPFALVFFDAEFQRMYRGWLRQLLTTPNPYTGRPLAREPALAMLELVNEDSLFFWTFSKKNIPPRYWRELETRFGQWLVRRHGSIARAYAAWGGAKLDGDAPDDRRMTVREAWFMTGAGLKQQGPAGRKRMADQVRFLAELQRGFYEQTIAYLRDELGYEGLVICSNWKTADAATLGRVERWTYTAGEVIDAHAYFGGEHKGEGSSYSVRQGHRYADASTLRRPERFPAQALQVAGHPQIISELGWPQPNRCRAEWLPMTAALASLQGIDGVFHFAVGSNFLVDAGMGKFQVGSPAVAFNSPAAALIYRRGDVRQATPSVLRAFDQAQLFSLASEGQMPNAMLDPLRKADLPDGVDAGDASTAFRRGPMVRAFGEARLRVPEPDPALLAQIRWDDQADRLVIDTPTARGVVGFFEDFEPQPLGPVTLDRFAHDFGSVLLVALDDRPLERSRRMLLQVMTHDQPFGYRTSGGNALKQITELGGPPFGIEKIDARLSIPANLQVTALDANGYPTNEALQRKATDAAAHVTLRPDRIYYLLERARR